jgi:hypothetical protein
LGKKLFCAFFIDALGWRVLSRHQEFLGSLFPYKKPLKTIFGYSNACDPSIISGQLPEKTGHWSSYYYCPKTSPFKKIKFLRLIPPFLRDRARVRHILSRIVSKLCHITGYFQLYSVPFEYIDLFDYAEKKRIFAKGGLLSGKSIFEELEERNIPYYVGDQDREEEQVEKLQAHLLKGDISFSYLLFGRLDALMHKVGPYSPEIDKLLQFYEEQILHLVAIAKERYDDIEIICFSDHGMHEVQKSFDLQAVIQALPLTYGKDYVAFYDATMARFWHLNERAKDVIRSCLSQLACGSILPEEKLQEWGVFFSDYKYGDTIFLMNPGELIVPSFMGLKPVKGMHGYAPDEEDSSAMVMSLKPIPSNITQIHELSLLWKDFLL